MYRCKKSVFSVIMLGLRRWFWWWREFRRGQWTRTCQEAWQDSSNFTVPRM